MTGVCAPRVVIVDDHAGFRRVARELLGLRGYAVVGEAGCAAEALDLVAGVARSRAHLVAKALGEGIVEL